ncbi:MAG: sigma 54-interacting transcriptional regulator [Faecousia sp.]
MAKVAILLPLEEMCALTASLLPEYPSLSPVCLDYVETQFAVSRALEVESSCDLIVARGVQARLIKHNTSRPVVEVQITTQELGMVMLELRKELGVERPRLGLVCFQNMIGDTSHFNELFEIDLKCYYVESQKELSGAVSRAAEEGCQAVIGGQTVCECARALHLPNRFLPTGTESLRNALAAASRVGYAIDQEKRNLSEMDTMLNNTFSGIMQVDRGGVIQRINRAASVLLNKKTESIVGQKAVECIPNLNGKLIDDALEFGLESYAIVLNIRQKAVVINIAPIRMEDEIRGAILTFQEDRQIIEMNSELRRELYQQGYVAKYSFDRIVCRSPQTQQMVKTAKQMAKFTAPVFLKGETGSGKSVIAQCIHKEGLNPNSAFVSVDCSAWMPETLDGMLFGNYTTRKDTPMCIAEMAQNGTLYLSNIDCMMLETQFKLLNLIRGKFYHNGAASPSASNVRIIASAEHNLLERVERGEFRRDLYYALNVLSLEIPPLRKRAEDIPEWMDYYLEEYQEKYKRYLHLTDGAKAYAQSYDWPGNLDQLKSVCERMVILTQKRNVDEVFLRKQLEEVTPLMTAKAERVVVVENPEALKISQLLSQYGGNREKVAAELGISKTTLWRYMKKYGIEPNYK